MADIDSILAGAKAAVAHSETAFPSSQSPATPAMPSPTAKPATPAAKQPSYSMVPPARQSLGEKVGSTLRQHKQDVDDATK